MSGIRDLLFQLVREGYVLVMGQLVLPILDVKDSFVPRGVFEQAMRRSAAHDLRVRAFDVLFAVESAGSGGESRIKFFEMIGGSDDQHSIVV